MEKHFYRGMKFGLTEHCELCWSSGVLQSLQGIQTHLCVAGNICGLTKDKDSIFSHPTFHNSILWGTIFSVYMGTYTGIFISFVLYIV